MSGSGDRQRHPCPFAFPRIFKPFQKTGMSALDCRREARAQDFGVSVSRPRSASSETAVLGNSFLSRS
jgi:hypothetical protein